MPRQRITDLKSAIESAPEMTDEHRRELLALVDSLAAEVEENPATDPAALRDALSAAEGVVRQREQSGAESAHDHDLAERLSELEQKVELAAVEHPLLANILAALSRLV